jgi:hypothetical protein
VGKTGLMPEPDTSCTVVNISSGIAKQNKSWILGRIVRDYNYWMPEKVKDELKENLAESHRLDKAREAERALEEHRQPRPVRPRTQAGLIISVLRTSADKNPGNPSADYIYYSGLLVTAVQLLIAVVLCIVYRDASSFAIFSITAVGTCLAYITGALPQWADEKWACRTLQEGKPKTLALTRGNGAQHVIIIVGQTGALDLEDLANGSPEIPITWRTRIWTAISVLLWAGLSLFATSIPNQRVWFLLLIGGLGSVQNLVAAQAPRRPETLGLYLELDYKFKVIHSTKVMKALEDLEEDVQGAGRSLLNIFFPAGIREDEKQRWATS